MRKMSKTQLKQRRHARIRARVIGTSERPRLQFTRTLRYGFGQVINDETGKTIVGIHTKTAKLTGDAGERTAKVAESFLLGKMIAEKAKAAGVTKVVFDRSGNAYQGRVSAFADGAREGGLEF